MRLHVIGCGGYIPVRNETSCFLVEQRGELIMLDAGTGATNLSKCQDILQRYDKLSVILSHFHLDHIIGLIYLVPFLRGRELHIYGPGKLAYGQATEEILNDLMRHPYFVRIPRELCGSVHIHDYGCGGFLIGDVPIGVAPQTHSDPSFRITIDDRLVYATDTGFDPNLLAACGKAKCLLHECVDITDTVKIVHTSLETLLRELKENPFDRILLIHQNPEWTDTDLQTISAMLSGTNLKLAADMTQYTL